MNKSWYTKPEYFPSNSVALKEKTNCLKHFYDLRIQRHS